MLLTTLLVDAQLMAYSCLAKSCDLRMAYCLSSAHLPVWKESWTFWLTACLAWTDTNSCSLSNLPMGLDPILNLSILATYGWSTRKEMWVLSSNAAWCNSLHFNSPAALKLMDGFPTDIPNTATIQIGCFKPTISREEKYSKMVAPNYVGGLSIKLHCSMTKSYPPQNTVLHQLASNWLSVTKAVMIHHKSRWSHVQLQLLNVSVIVLVRLVLELL